MSIGEKIRRDLAELARQERARELRALALDAMDRAARGAPIAHMSGGTVVPFGFNVRKGQ